MENNIKLFINRPLAFLCGPSINRKDPFDRRLVVSNFIESLKKVDPDGRSSFEMLPIIVDDLLEDKYMKENKLSYKVVEEIISAISFRTYIFLDTMSTGYEYGLFDNSYANNITIPFLEDSYSKRKQRKIGDYILKSHNTDNFCLYDAKVKRRTEFVYFKKKTGLPPESIQKKLKEDFDELYSRFGSGTDINYVDASERREDKEGVIYFSYNKIENKISFIIDPRTSFYLLVGIFNSKEIEYISKNENHALSLADKKYKEFLLKTFITMYKNVNDGTISSIILRKPNIQLTIGSFTNSYSVLQNEFYVAKRLNEILSEKKSGSKTLKSVIKKEKFVVNTNYNFFLDLFNFKRKDERLIRNVYKEPGKYFTYQMIKISGKNRQIITYQNNSNGVHLRNLHNTMSSVLYKYFSPSQCSFAYHKECSTLLCLKQHEKSTSFLKLDIHSFFNSITFDRMTIILRNELTRRAQGLYKRFLPKTNQIKSFLGSCFYDKKLPLGLITSPILSDIYLHQLDVLIVKKFPNIVYTRYADDILFSTTGESDILFAARDYLIGEFKELGLTINKEKKAYVKFEHEGDSIHYLGINLVYGKEKSRFTISKKVLRNYAKYFQKNMYKLNKNTDKLKGIMLYIKSISQDSYEKLVKTLRISCDLEISYNWTLYRKSNYELPF